MKTIKELLMEQRERHGWKEYHNPKDLAVALNIETSELLENFLWKENKDLNAFLEVFEESARQQAKLVDEKIKNGTAGRLAGMVIGLKDNMCYKGHKVSAASKILFNFESLFTGTAVERLIAQDAIIIGRLNCDEFAMGSSNENSAFGGVKNPIDLDRVPGGSSGGSAAALAAGFTGLEAGSDIGGSIRNPAHFCGVYGHKPTYGIIPMTGHELVSNVPDADLAVCGPLARSAEDVRQALDIMAGPAEREAAGWKLDLPEADFKNLKDLKIAVWANDEMAPVSHEIEERAIQVGETLTKLGATVSFDARPKFDPETGNINYQLLLHFRLPMIVIL